MFISLRFSYITNKVIFVRDIQEMGCMGLLFKSIFVAVAIQSRITFNVVFSSFGSTWSLSELLCHL